ncbi:hypothetical protein WJX84_009052 [Apatococcus fuscideae]|uniref:Dynein axonemal light chain 1 n=1 Tax=Apatococcus fuscideae TaxID=2026836 RepID=A0AAW1T2H3_9CHLO
MAKSTSIKDAVANFEKAKGVVAAETEKIELWGQVPPIDKMDGVLASLKACKHLSLSTNSIEKIGSLAGMDSLRSLSLGRNQIKKLENLEAVAPTLEELWVSYNLLERLGGCERLNNLRILFVSNNKLRDWSEVERLASLPKLEEVLFAGNPFYNDYKDKQAIPDYRIEVLKRLPNLKKLDGIPVDVDEREAAAAKRGA